MTRPARCVGFVVPGVHDHDAEVELLVDEKPSRNDLTGIACGWPKSRDARRNPCWGFHSFTSRVISPKSLKAEVRCRSQQIGLNVSMKFSVAERYIALSSVVTSTRAQKTLEAFK